jgi:hypothetical protein
MILFGRDDLGAGKPFSPQLRSFPDEFGANAQGGGSSAKFFLAECKPVTESARRMRYSACK